MTIMDRLRPPSGGHPVHGEEWASILLCLGSTLVAVLFIWLDPGLTPASGPMWALPVWIAFLYVLVQITFLLVSATQIRALGVIDSILAIVPVVAGLVLAVEWALGHLHLSGFQAQTLAALVIGGGSEFLLTLSIRFVLNRRTFAVDSAN